ncbi:hypothetical protein ES702_05467 [subsurface metagenome]
MPKQDPNKGGRPGENRLHGVTGLPKLKDMGLHDVTPSLNISSGIEAKFLNFLLSL